MKWNLLILWAILRLKGTYIDHIHRSGTGSLYVYFKLKGKWRKCRLSDHPPRKAVQNRMLLGKEPETVCLFQVAFL